MTSVSQDAAASAGYRSRQQTWRRFIPKRWYAHIILWFSCIMLGIPLFYSIIVATQSNSDVYSYQFLPGSALADNWDIAINQRNLHTYIFNSVLVAIAITVGKTALSLLSGLAFVYFRFPGKWLIFGFVLVTLMMPTEVLIIALFRFVNQLGWDNYAALIVPFLASATGTFLFRQHFSNLPTELSEAAQLDGANPLQFLFRILVPMSWNTIGALAVVQFVFAWNMYLWPDLIISDPKYDVVQVGIGTLRAGESALQYGPLMLGSVLASLPPLIIFLLLQRQFMSGFQLSQEK
jgi:sn-glycerol 3-phosphate transport system permease protein